ncbi:hypothetical protein GCM10017744_093000 [Streptomyces antimycoticus]
MLGLFCVIENRVAQPMFHLGLFRIRAFTAGNVASLLAALGRGGLMFILIIWLQGIWLPRHGYGFEETPLWAGIYMLPLTIGFLIAGPFSGWASDRFGARTFTTGGMLVAAATFVALEELPVDFGYPVFAAILLVNGIAMGLFSSPNRAAIMNSLPPDQRGVGAGISTTFQNSATVLSIGIFFSLMIAGLASSLPGALTHGLTAEGVPASDAARVAALPPVGVLFASLLGYNPVRTLLGPQVLDHLPAHHAAYLTGRGFFPALISPPFSQGLSAAFDFAIAACLVAAVASLLRGGRYVHKGGPKSVAPAGVAAAHGGTAGAADTAGSKDVEEEVPDTARHPAPAHRQPPPPKSGPPPPPPSPPPLSPPSSSGGGTGPPPEEPR